jgi:hypothetical protein
LQGCRAQPLAQRSCTLAEHVLEMTPRVAQIAQVILRRPKHPLANEQIGRASLVRRNGIVPLRECQRGSALSVTDVIIPQTPERTKPVLGVAKPLGGFEYISPGRTCFGTWAFRMEQRRGKEGVQLHLKTCASVHARTQAGECTFDAPTEFVHQRQAEP